MKVFLMGGAGNEFFQLARAHYLRQLGFQVTLVDLSLFKKTLYKLIKFTYHKPWIAIDDVANHLALGLEKPGYRDYLTLAGIFFLRKLGCNLGFNRPISRLSGEAEHGRLSLNFDVGYFQSSSHVGMASIKAVADAIITTLQIRRQCGERKMLVHVRGGDVATENKITDRDAEGIVKYCAEENLKLSCVSNDAEYARSIFSGLNYDFLSEGSSAKHDFVSLASASEMYVSNSTFAFWAAMCAYQISPVSLFGPENWEFGDFIHVKSICSS